MLTIRSLLARAYSSLIRAIDGRVRRYYTADILLAVSVAVYTIAFSYISIIRYYGFFAHAWDLGNYNQAMYTTLRDGKLLYYTSDMAANPSTSIMGVHFSPLLLMLLPFYAISPRPETLLIIQSLFLGLGAVPIYKLTQWRLGSRVIGLAFSTIYLLNPSIQGINWVDFHPEAFIPFFALLAIYFMDTANWNLYFVSVFLTLSTMEPAAFLVLLTGVYYGWRNRAVLRQAIRKRDFHSTQLRILSLTIAISLGWLTVALYIIRLYNQDLTLFGGIYTWQTLGAKSLLAVPVVALTNPGAALNALANNLGQKIMYVLAILGTLGFLPLASFSLAGVGFAWLGVGLLSDNSVYYSLGTAYPAFTIPFIMSAFVLASRKLSPRALRMTILYTTLAALFLSPLTFGSLAAYPFSGPYGIPSIAQHNRDVMALLDRVPADAPILTQDNLFPFVSDRVDAYVVPTRSYFPVGTSFDTQLAMLVGRAQYVLLDPVSDVVPAYFTFPLLKAGGFGLIASADGAVLYERGYTGPAQLVSQFTRTFNYTNLWLLCCRTSNDSAAISKVALVHEPKYAQSGSFWSGPWVSLPPGNYTVSFRLRASPTGSGPVVSIGMITNRINVGEALSGLPGQGVAIGFPIYTDPNPTVNRTFPLSDANFTISGNYQTFTFSLVLDSFQFALLPGYILSPSASIGLDRIVLVQQGVSLG